MQGRCHRTEPGQPLGPSEASEQGRTRRGVRARVVSGSRQRRGARLSGARRVGHAWCRVSRGRTPMPSVQGSGCVTGGARACEGEEEVEGDRPQPWRGCSPGRLSLSAWALSGAQAGCRLRRHVQQSPAVTAVVPGRKAASACGVGPSCPSGSGLRAVVPLRAMARKGLGFHGCVL